MSLKLSTSNLQPDKYTYTWKRTDGDGKYIAPSIETVLARLRDMRYWSS